jgi:hypothetical protein
MTLSLLPVQDLITAELNELAQTVYENSVPDDKLLEHSNDGMLLPFIVIRHSGFVQRANERGITGPRQDLGRAFAEIMCVGPTERSARQVLDLVTDKLTGFQPTGGSILTPEGIGKPYVVYDASGKASKFVADITFSYAVNTVVS